MRRTLRILLLALTFAALGASPAAPARNAKPEPEFSSEALLNKAFEDIGRERFDKALGHIDALLGTLPNFRLAHLIRGDLLLAKARSLTTLGDAPNGPSERLVDLRQEAIARLRAYRERPDPDQVPNVLLQMQPDQKHAVVVDTGRARLYLSENDGGTPRFVSDYYISSGKRGASSSFTRPVSPPFHGQTSWQMSQPKIQLPSLGRNATGIGPRNSIVRYEMHSRGSIR